MNILKSIPLPAGRKVHVGLARGGRYRDTALDTQVPYLKVVLGFLGMTDVEFFHAEGLNMGPEAEAQGQKKKRGSGFSPTLALMTSTRKESP